MTPLIQRPLLRLAQQLLRLSGLRAFVMQNHQMGLVFDGKTGRVMATPAGNLTGDDAADAALLTSTAWAAATRLVALDETGLKNMRDAALEITQGNPLLAELNGNLIDGMHAAEQAA